MKLKLIALSLCVVAVAACGGRAPKKQKAVKTVELEVPVPPMMMEDPQERSEFVLEHYWDNYKPEVDSVSLEQAFSNWCALTQYASRAVATKSLLKGYDKAPERILPLADKYLYDPNSPMRDEDFYGALMAHTGNAELAALCALNAVGTKAADFEFEDARGRRHRLYDIEAPFTILFFSNPGCHACKEIIDDLCGSPAIYAHMSTGAVQVLSIYIDEDLDAWREYVPNYPKSWIVGFDPSFTLRTDDIYHIRAIPSVYLLDADKKVIFKDVPTERLIAYLENILL